MNRNIFFVLLLSILAHLTQSTIVVFTNRCRNEVSLIRTENGQNSVLECNLGTGQNCHQEFNGGSMNFKDGWSGKTLAEFTFNGYQGVDYYDLSVIVGFDVGMQIIAPFGAPSLICTYPGCPDAYHSPNDKKTESVRTGGTFYVNLCP
eukprot:TRINITY_DN10342_c0_g1_i1.p1 TRINITY_DN10342_c0_g1~~TRINITY_DN10342_c0_g1_i1.p1  ORF type:complete len:148 (-),score=17.55 TRINITY_DN10342_c0_g1_i1:30-473(-)